MWSREADEGPDDRRADRAFRKLVQDCQAILDGQGFRLTSRGGSHTANWVRFSSPAQNAHCQDGTLSVLLAHSPAERAVLAEAYFEDTALRIAIPHRKLLQRYDDARPLPPVLREFVTSVCRAAPGRARGRLMMA
ncbi:MAG TPA: hypothetical protein VII06_34705 [Chloroflexota bacterium]|jgi:hypothetical protein